MYIHRWDVPTRDAASETLVVATSGPDEGASDESIGVRSTDADAPSDCEPLALVPANDYRPAMTFRVVARLPAPITVELLRLPGGDRVPVLTGPDEYTGYVVRSTVGDDQVDTTTHVYVRGTLEAGARYAFETDAKVFDTGLNLFRATVRRLDSSGE